MHTSISRGLRIVGALALTIAVAAGCASPHDTTPPAPADPIKFGFIYSQTGSLAGYAPPYLRGFEAGLAFATKGTGKINGRPIEVVKADDGGDPAKATSAMKDLIGQGVKIIGGTGSSSVAVQLAPLAAQNKVLFISGPAATDAITGANRYTFRAGRQTLQDILNIKHAIGDTTLKKVAVFVQDNTFGQGNLAAVKAVAFGATVSGVLVPASGTASATDFTPFALQAKQIGADILFVAWAGDTGPAMWQALHQQGVLDGPKVITGLDQRATWPAFGAAGPKITFAAHYIDGATDNEAAKALRSFAPGGPADTFGPDGFNLAQMLVRAAEAGGGEDVEKMVSALEGWSFDGVKGKMTIRASDHALMQPMFHAALSGPADNPTARITKTVSADECAPPVTQMKA